MIPNICTIGHRPTACISWKIFNSTLKQYRNNQIWATKREKKTSIDLALDYFDTVYGPWYGKRWPSIRLALLSPHKYCAVVNNYNEPDKTCDELQNIGAIHIREMFEAHERSLSEKKKSRYRKKDMDRKHALERKLNMDDTNNHEAEMKNVYSDNFDKEDLTQEELIQKAKEPLERSLAEAMIDTDRQIDPAEGLASSRLFDFVPVSKMKGNEKFVPEEEHFAFYNDEREIPVTIEHEKFLRFPAHLQIYTYTPGDLSDFRPAKSGATGLLVFLLFMCHDAIDYYVMDAASLLPVLALNLEPGDTVLDMCAAPGGKSLLCLQTFYPDLVFCNDSSLSRLNRLRHVIQRYCGNIEEKVIINNESGTMLTEKFSKILVDVPCTTDRHSVTENDNNIFKPTRNRERILLPQLQVELLLVKNQAKSLLLRVANKAERFAHRRPILIPMDIPTVVNLYIAEVFSHALKLVKVGGSVVYSTCSLNPAQNDGVVGMALRRVWEETSMKIVVKDLSEALIPAEILFRFAEPGCLKYGSLVVPYLPSNFGPMYFCKLEKKSEEGNIENLCR